MLALSAAAALWKKEIEGRQAGRPARGDEGRITGESERGSQAGRRRKRWKRREGTAESRGAFQFVLASPPSLALALACMRKIRNGR